MSEIQRCDKMLDAFNRDTDIWPPGRSMPAAMCGGDDNVQDMRWKAFRYWQKARAHITALEAERDGLLGMVNGLEAENAKLKEEVEEAQGASEAWHRNMREVEAERDMLKNVVEGLVGQFAYWSEKAGGYSTGGLSALEQAFDALGWPDPRPCEAARCDEPGCMGRATCGTTTEDGYRRTCGEHRPVEAARAREGDQASG